MYIISFFSALVSMFVIDLVWLFTVVPRLYPKYLGDLFLSEPRYIPAAIFYLVYIAALTVLVIVPSIQSGSSFLKVFLFGALFGLAAYGTYDLTNHATLKGWVTIITVTDMAWGALITGIASVVAVYVNSLWK